MTPRTARARSRRGGYALLLVIGFNVLLLAAWSVAYRSVGSAVRVELARSLRKARDDGTMTALGRAVALLQTGTPPVDGSGSYVCYIQLDVSGVPRWFAVAYASVPSAPDGTVEAGVWTVRAHAVDSGGSPTLPTTFARSPIP